MSGLGDEAIWDPTQKTLFILKGASLVFDRGGSTPLARLKAVGAIAVGADVGAGGPAGIIPVDPPVAREPRLEVPALRLLALDRLEERLEVADPEAARAVALDDLEEERRAILDGAA